MRIKQSRHGTKDQLYSFEGWPRWSSSTLHFLLGNILRTFAIVRIFRDSSLNLHLEKTKPLLIPVCFRTSQTSPEPLPNGCTFGNPAHLNKFEKCEDNWRTVQFADFCRAGLKKNFLCRIVFLVFYLAWQLSSLAMNTAKLTLAKNVFLETLSSTGCLVPERFGCYLLVWSAICLQLCIMIHPACLTL